MLTLIQMVKLNSICFISDTKIDIGDTLQSRLSPFIKNKKYKPRKSYIHSTLLIKVVKQIYIP